MPLPFWGRSIRAVDLGGGFFVQNRAEFSQESVVLEAFFSIAEVEPVAGIRRAVSQMGADK